MAPASGLWSSATAWPACACSRSSSSARRQASTSRWSAPSRSRPTTACCCPPCWPARSQPPTCSCARATGTASTALRCVTGQPATRRRHGQAQQCMLGSGDLLPFDSLAAGDRLRADPPAVAGQRSAGVITFRILADVDGLEQAAPAGRAGGRDRRRPARHRGRVRPGAARGCRDAGAPHGPR